MTIEEVAAGLGKELGIALNVVDDAFAMDFGGKPFMVMRIAGERGEMLTMACDLGEMPPQAPEKLYEALLNANWAYRGAAGAVFARHPGGSACLSYPHDVWEPGKMCRKRLKG